MGQTESKAFGDGSVRRPTLVGLLEPGQGYTDDTREGKPSVGEYSQGGDAITRVPLRQTLFAAEDDLEGKDCKPKGETGEKVTKRKVKRGRSCRIGPASAVPVPPPARPAADVALSNRWNLPPIGLPLDARLPTQALGQSCREINRPKFSFDNVMTSSSEADGTQTSMEALSAGSSHGPSVGRVSGRVLGPFTSDRASLTQDDGTISVTQLYNKMADGQLSPYLFDPSCLLIVDTRDEGLYRNSHITTSYHVEELDRNDQLLPLHEYSLIVVYDNNGLTHSLTESTLSVTVEHLQGKRVAPMILQGGFEAFDTAFPFLCNDRVVCTGKERQKLLVQYPSAILHNLYLGRGDQAANENIVTDLKISHIVNITKEHFNAFEDKIKYHNVKVNDEAGADILSKLPAAIQFIQDAIADKGIVLVHCNLGASRSSTVVIAYLMLTRRMSLKDSYLFVKERRPIIDPNRGFRKQLGKFEIDVFGKILSDARQIWSSSVDLQAQ